MTLLHDFYRTKLIIPILKHTKLTIVKNFNKLCMRRYLFKAKKIQSSHKTASCPIGSNLKNASISKHDISSFVWVEIKFISLFLAAILSIFALINSKQIWFYDFYHSTFFLIWKKGHIKHNSLCNCMQLMFPFWLINLCQAFFSGVFTSFQVKLLLYLTV